MATTGALLGSIAGLLFAAGSASGGDAIFSDAFESPPPPPLRGRPLNDTGVTTCGDAVLNDLPCSVAQYPGQDAEFGSSGFVFTKLDDNGAPLANQNASYLATPWECVRDEVTGLVWEVKTIDGTRGSAHTYSWFQQGAASPGEANGGVCDAGMNCDTEHYIDAINAVGLCGLRDWRLPSQQELLSIVDYGRAEAPMLVSDLFPNSENSQRYWSSNQVNPSARSRFVDFASGTASSALRNQSLAVRAASSGRGL